MKRLLLVLTVAALAFAAACGSTTTTSSTPPVTTNPTASSTQMPGTPVSVAGGGTYWDITPAQLAGFTVKDFILADTDTTYIGEIGGTDLFLNSDTISQELSKFPADKTAKIVIYCTAGVKTQAVAVTLVQAGYTRVMELQGGITAWQAAGYPTTFLTRTMA